MQQLIAFIKKEIYHIARDRKTLLVLIGMPIVQIALFGFALSNEVKNTKLYVIDQNKDEMSVRFIEEVQASQYFDVVGYGEDVGDVDRILRSGVSQISLVVPPSFSSDLRHVNQANLQLITDAINPNVAATINAYITAISRDFRNTEMGDLKLPYTINVETRMMYNPQLKGEFAFVPGVIAMILMIICVLMTSVSIVKEKELGNMEMLLVSPTSPAIVIISKAIPYFVLSLLIISIILLMSTTILQVPIRGNIFLLYGVSSIFIITSLTLGLLISTLTNSQEIAMLISLMGMLLPTIMFGGFMFPIESMPKALQIMSNIIPAKWFYYAINDIMIKGLGWSSVYREVLILLGFTLLYMGISLKKYEIRLS